MSILEQRIRAARAEGRTALIPFLTAGFPDRDRFWDVLRELDASGADVIEIGVPFSDPVADGPVVEGASRRALEQGVTLRGLMEGLARRAGSLRAGLVLMGYVNPFMRYGLERFAEDAARAGVHGCIVPDLPLEESGPFREALAGRGIDLLTLVGPNTTEERMALYAPVSRGYVYVASVLGTTGERAGLPPEAEAALERAGRVFSIPVALGFGLREPGQLAGLPPEKRPDAAVFGSALLKHLDAGGTAASFLDVWKGVSSAGGR